MLHRHTISLAQKDNPATRRRRFATPFGFALTALILAALIGAAYFALGAIQKVVTAYHETTLQQYEDYLRPFVMVDPPPFTHIREADPEKLLEIALWSALQKNTDAFSEMPLDADNRLLLGQDKTAAEFRRLFGDEISPRYQSIRSFGVEFEYVAHEQAFHIPVTGVTPRYIPDVEQARRQGGAMVLQVAYLPVHDPWDRENTQGPAKYMQVTLYFQGGQPYISSLHHIKHDAGL